MKFNDGAGQKEREEFERRLGRLQGEAGQASGSTIVDSSNYPGHVTKPITPRPKAQPKPKEELDYDTQKAQTQVKRTLRSRYKGTVTQLRENAEEQARRQVNLPLVEV